MTGWSICEDTCDTAALVVTELVTNAIVHTASNVVVCELHDGDDVVRIAVRDEGCAPGEPHPSPQRPEEEHGRGLLLVDALCHAWGAQEHGPGLMVWAELPRTADPVGDADTGIGAWADIDHCAEVGPDTDGDHEEPRNDLGWGTRPKPGGPSDGSGEDTGPARQAHHTPEDSFVPSPNSTDSPDLDSPDSPEPGRERGRA